MILAQIRAFRHLRNAASADSGGGLTTLEVVLCAIVALAIAAIEIVFFTPLIFGGNER